jgi:hypothetical protein
MVSVCSDNFSITCDLASRSMSVAPQFTIIVGPRSVTFQAVSVMKF